MQLYIVDGKDVINYKKYEDHLEITPIIPFQYDVHLMQITVKEGGHHLLNISHSSSFNIISHSHHIGRTNSSSSLSNKRMQCTYWEENSVDDMPDIHLEPNHICMIVPMIHHSFMIDGFMNMMTMYQTLPHLLQFVVFLHEHPKIVHRMDPRHHVSLTNTK